jgi:hypothetical protein
MDATYDKHPDGAERTDQLEQQIADALVSSNRTAAVAGHSPAVTSVPV